LFHIWNWSHTLCPETIKLFHIRKQYHTLYPETIKLFYIRNWSHALCPETIKEGFYMKMGSKDRSWNMWEIGVGKGMFQKGKSCA
jgi:hypothetical protein